MNQIFSGASTRHFLVIFSVLFVGLCLCSSPAVAQLVTLTMDDLDFQPVDGLIHPTGVAFGYTIDGQPSDDANYASGGPGMAIFVQDPSLEGSTAGVLTIDFPEPTSVVEFGMALLGDGTVEDAVDVELLALDGTSLFSEGLDFETFDTFTEAQFVYSGAAVSTMIVDLTPAFQNDPILPRFAFDNLTFVVPEPSSAVLLGSALLLAGSRPRRGLEWNVIC